MPTPPDFKPDPLVAALGFTSEREKWLFETVSKEARKSDWIIEEMARQSDIQGGILRQTTQTNGRLLKAEGDIKELQVTAARHEQDITLIDTVLKVLRTKWFWIVFLSASAIFFLGALPWVYANHITLHQLVSLIVKFAS